jgi:hypothetical protein
MTDQKTAREEAVKTACEKYFEKWNERLTVPELKPLYPAYRHEYQEASRHWKSGANWALDWADLELAAKDKRIRELEEALRGLAGIALRQYGTEQKARESHMYGPNVWRIVFDALASRQGEGEERDA